MVGVIKLKQMVGVAINTYLVAQRELEYHLNGCAVLPYVWWAGFRCLLQEGPSGGLPCNQYIVGLLGGASLGFSVNRNQYIVL